MKWKIMPREIIRNIAAIQITCGALSHFFLSISNRNNILYVLNITSLLKG